MHLVYLIFSHIISFQNQKYQKGKEKGKWNYDTHEIMIFGKLLF